MAQCEELPNSKVVPQHRQPPVQGPGAPTPRNFPKGTVITPRFLPNLTLGELSLGPSVPLSGNQSVTLHEDPPPQPPTAHPLPQLLGALSQGKRGAKAIPGSFSHHWKPVGKCLFTWEITPLGKATSPNVRHVGQSMVPSAWPPLRYPRTCHHPSLHLQSVCRPPTTPAPLSLHLQSADLCALSTGCREPTGNWTDLSPSCLEGPTQD